MVQVNLYHFDIQKKSLFACATLEFWCCNLDFFCAYKNCLIMETEDFSDFDDSDADRDYLPESEYEDENDDDQETVEVENISRKKGRKRTRNPNEYKRTLKKKLRDSGKEYIGHRSMLKPGKEFIHYVHNCRYSCKNISEADARVIFNSFWELADWNRQTAYIASCIKIRQPFRVRNNAVCHKSKSISISLTNQRVCKDFFLKTLQISNGRYSRVANRKSSFGFVSLDKRGKGNNPNKIQDVDLNGVREHINKFPKYKSHYARKDNPNKSYLPSHLTIRKMYKSYVEECAETQRLPVKEWCYRDVFNREFNLSFHQPLTDTCSKCDKFKIQLQACESEDIKKTLEHEQSLHLRRAEKGVSEKKKS